MKISTTMSYINRIRTTWYKSGWADWCEVWYHLSVNLMRKEGVGWNNFLLFRRGSGNHNIIINMPAAEVVVVEEADEEYDEAISSMRPNADHSPAAL
jgi:hypothetical protein